MGNRKRNKIVMVPLICLAVLAHGDMVSAAKVKKVTMNLAGTKTLNMYPAAMDTAKKVTVKSSNKSVATVKYKKAKGIRRIVLTARKTGTAAVTVKCRMKNKKTKTYKYKVKVVRGKKTTELDQAKKAFKIQNQYRKAKGVKALEWSDELYRFCLYRLKTSGFDKHINLGKDKNVYFGLYSQFSDLDFGENLYSGSADPESAMKAWKKSSAHYHNILIKEYKCGAIARHGNIWCAIFCSEDKSKIENWRNYQIKEVKVKRYDSASASYIGNCSIGYYEKDNRWDSQQAATIKESSGKSVYLEIGKTYVIYERKTPDGYNKAGSVTVTVTEDGASEVVLAG
ncbi:MAG: CAP domain-containing protein [Ruminococcus flavefaciens]|nr:CAP domain-containing protein [Ruminococcus flavefaciens]